MSETKETQELNLDQKVTVRSIAGWTVGFARRADFGGDVMIAPGGNVRLTRNEIITQIQNGNKLFTGTDGMGSHATLVIEDTPTRVEIGFESVDGKTKQLVFSDDVVTALFKGAKFEERLREVICTRAEKHAVIDAIKRLKINDYQKIRLVEEYTGCRL